MSNQYAKKVNRTAVRTPQNMQASPDQVENHAGGFSFEVDNWSMLDRFVILGTEHNTYYANSNELTNQNYEAVIACVKENGLKAVNRIVELSDQGRAVKNAPAVFALAVCATFGDKITKEAAFRSMPKVARIATDFFAFINSYKSLGGGFGTVARKGIEAWYQDKDISKVAYQMVKYRQRDGWTHLDALRLSHAKPRTPAESNLYAFAKTLAGKEHQYDIALLPDIAQAFLSAQNTLSTSDVVDLITDYNLPREAIPTHMLNDVEVWEALLQKMPATALIRNLGKMSSMGMFVGNNDNTKLVVNKLQDSEWLRKSRLHPVVILNAMSMYRRGRGNLGSLSWTPSSRILDALNDAFYGAFNNIEPTGKRIMLALDTSGSMSISMRSAGNMVLSPREITAAMAMATAKVEEDYVMTYFSDANTRSGWPRRGHTGIEELSVSPKQRLDDVVRSISNLPWGGTDCSLPMTWAMENNLVIDTFVIYTDNDTWSGNIHPHEALNQYRRKVNPEAKLVVCATEPYNFSIADPKDAGMLDIVGFDSNAPELISNFARGM